MSITLVLLNHLNCLQETLTVLCLITIAEEVKSMKKRQLHILIVASKRPKIKQAKLRLIMTTRSRIGVQLNSKCLQRLQRLLTVISHVVPTVMMVVHITMDIIKQMQIGVHRLTNLTPLILVVNHIFLNPTQAAKLMTIFKSSITGLLITATITIIVPQFMLEIRVQVVNLGWTQCHRTFSNNNGQIEAIRKIKMRKPIIKSLLAIRSGGDYLYFSCGVLCCHCMK